jgi:hypothetical protein
MNRFLFYRVGLALAIGTLLVGCVNDTRQQETSTAKEDFAGRLLEVAQTYESYGRLDPVARWGVSVCSDAGLNASVLFGFSSSTDADTHGRKLYSLFVKEQRPNLIFGGCYTRAGEPNPVGQVVVKESWVPEEVKEEEPQRPNNRKVMIRRDGKLVEETDDFLPYARKDGRLYHAKEKLGLFIMLKLDPETPGTDDGWVYGTVTADGKTVTSKGRVASCMKCHQDAPHDRLFGLTKR